MGEIVKYADGITSEKLAKDICDIMEKASDEPWFQEAMAQTDIDTKIARKHYVKDVPEHFKAKNLCKSELLETEIAICEFILSLNGQLCGQVNVAITDLQDCIWQQFRKGDHEDSFDYERYRKKVHKSVRAWEYAVRKAATRILRILNKNEFEFSDKDINILCDEKDKLVALYFSHPDY